jgi:single-stranded-DNA-specific exonuclease
MYRPRRWNLAAPHEAAEELASRLKTSPLIAQILLNRGITDPDLGRSFLSPSLKALHEPSLIPGLDQAANRIAQAIRDQEKIAIYGDYDVDGITATTILWHAIRRLGGEVCYYIPHRIEEGYGLNSEAVEQLCNEGAKLIVTVDCGVTAIEPARIACERRVDLIITDHHEFKEGSREGSGFGVQGSDSREMSSLNPEPRTPNPLIPDCFCVVHPRLPGATVYPNENLCGAGVAFKLAWGIGKAVSGSDRVSEDFRAFLMDALALTALGTIADVVPLTGENRIIAHYGLGTLKQSRLTGIRALIASAKLDGQNIDSYHVGFLLAPRLNACGRMGHARLAVEMLTTATEEKATEIASYLEQQNRARQTLERKILEEALEQAKQLKLDADDSRAIVLGAEGWHAGVIGIVASRIVDRFHRPTIMVALNNGLGQGSGRSISGFHLAKALHVVGEHLEAHGGHEMAAGLKVKSEKFEAFRRAFIAHAGEVLDPQLLVPELKLDTLAALEQVTEALVHELQRLGPFGHGNRKPLLCCQNLTLAAPPRKVGKTGDHLQLMVQQGRRSMKCIAFNAAALFEKLTPGMTLSLAVEPQINEFNGRISVELEVKDVQFQPA